MSDPILTLSGVVTDIGRCHILHGVDLTVPCGQVTMLLGRKGVGRTTTLRTIMGLWRARAGEIAFDGQGVGGLAVSDRARAGSGYVREDMRIFSDLTVGENMALADRSGAIADGRRAAIVAALPPPRTFWHAPALTLSGGQKQMSSIARVMAEPRRLFLIDEPTKGLAPAIVATMTRALRDLKAGGASILLVEQNFAVARAPGDTAAVMDDGTSSGRGRCRRWRRTPPFGTGHGPVGGTGLTPVFGLMDVINFGHGAFILEGAFVGVTALGAMSGWVGRGRSR